MIHTAVVIALLLCLVVWASGRNQHGERSALVQVVDLSVGAEGDDGVLTLQVKLHSRGEAGAIEGKGTLSIALRIVEDVFDTEIPGTANNTCYHKIPRVVVEPTTLPGYIEYLDIAVRVYPPTYSTNSQPAVYINNSENRWSCSA